MLSGVNCGTGTSTRLPCGCVNNRRVQGDDCCQKMNGDVKGGEGAVVVRENVSGASTKVPMSAWNIGAFGTRETVKMRRS